MAVRILLVAEQRLAADLYVRALGASGRFEVTGVASDVGAAAMSLKSAPADAVLIDLPSAGPSREPFAEALRRYSPGIHVVVLMGDSPTEEDRRAASGANVTLGRDRPFEELAAALLGGERPNGSRNGNGRATTGLESLSPREREIYAALMRGLSSKQIGQELAISHRTVETHRAHILRKLQARSSMELIFRRAQQGGLPLAANAFGPAPGAREE